MRDIVTLRFVAGLLDGATEERSSTEGWEKVNKLGIARRGETHCKVVCCYRRVFTDSNVITFLYEPNMMIEPGETARVIALLPGKV